MTYPSGCRYKNWLTLVLLFSLFLNACQDSSESDRTTIITFVSDSVFSNLKDYVDQFEAVHPEIRIRMTYQQEISSEWPKNFDAALLSGTLDNWRPGLWLDLNPLIASDLQFDADDYLAGALSSGYAGGHLVALPVSLSFDVLAYNPLQLSAAGATLPVSDWSWEDLRATALTLAHYYQKNNGFVFADSADPSIFLFGWLAGRAPLSENVEGRPIPLLDRPEMQAALPNACRMLSELPVDPEASSLASERLARLQAGEAAMTILPYGLVRSLFSEYPGLAMSPLPQPSKSLRIAASLAISRGTTHPQAVWEWIRFLSHQYLPAASSDLPARKSIAQNQRVLERLDTGAAQVLRAIMADRAPLSLEQHRESLQIIKEELWDALFKTCRQGVPVDTALKSAQESTQKKLADWYADQQVQPTPFSVKASVPVAKTAKILNFVALDGNDPFYQAAAEAFAATHPEWSIQFGEMNPEAVSQADCLALRLHTFDLFMLLDLQDSFLSFGSSVELAPPLTQDSFFSQAIQAVSWHGRLLAIPITVQPLILYYDPEIFLESGLSLPTSEWTVTDMLDAAQEIAAAAPHQLGYVPREGTEVRFVLEQQGVPLFSDGPPLEPRFTAPDVLLAIEQLGPLQSGQGLISNRTAAMTLSTFFGKMPAGSNWRATALEPYPGTIWPITLSLGVVNKSSSNVQMAWEWLAFLVQWDGTRGDDFLPSIHSLAANENIRLELGEELHTAYLMALERDVTQFDLEKTLVEKVAATWFDLALREVKSEEDLEHALGQAQSKAGQFIACQNSMGQIDIHTLATCAKQADPEHWLAKLGDD